jgi:hypothetical protein
LKICIYTSKLTLWVNFFMVYDIDTHQLNLRPFRNLKFLDEILFKNCVFCIYVLCTLFLSNLLHLTIGSRLILTQNELWGQCCHANYEMFCLCLRLLKDTIKILGYHILWYLLYITLFGEKWFTFNVLSTNL